MATANLIERWTATIRAARKYQAGVQAYCVDHGINYQTYSKWFRQLRKQHPEFNTPGTRGRKPKQTAGPFVPVKVVTDAPAIPQLSVEIRLTGGSTVVFPNGLSTEQLSVLIQRLEAKQC